MRPIKKAHICSVIVVEVIFEMLISVRFCHRCYFVIVRSFQMPLLLHNPLLPAVPPRHREEQLL